MAYAETIKVAVGDTRPEISVTLRDQNTAASGQTLDPGVPSTWAPIDLTGATVRLRIREIGSSTVTATITMTLTSASGGVASTTFPSGTWTTAGIFEGEIEITFGDDTVQTVEQLLKFNVRDDFD